MNKPFTEQPELLQKHLTKIETVSCGDSELESHRIGDDIVIMQSGVVIATNPSVGDSFFEKKYPNFVVNVFYKGDLFFDVSIRITAEHNFPDDIKRVSLLANNEVMIGYGDDPVLGLLIGADGKQKILPGVKEFCYLEQWEGCSYNFGGRIFYVINLIDAPGVCIDETGESLTYGDRKIVGIRGIIEDTVFGRILEAKVDDNHTVYYDEDFNLIEDRMQLDTGDEWYILDRLGNKIGPYQEIIIIPALKHPKYEDFEKGAYNFLLVDAQGNVFDCKSIIYKDRKVSAMSNLLEGYRLHFEDGTILDISEHDLLRYMLTNTVQKMNELVNY